jgi:hypothetical protein
MMPQSRINFKSELFWVLTPLAIGILLILLTSGVSGEIHNDINATVIKTETDVANLIGAFNEHKKVQERTEDQIREDYQRLSDKIDKYQEKTDELKWIVLGLSILGSAGGSSLPRLYEKIRKEKNEI